MDSISKIQPFLSVLNGTMHLSQGVSLALPYIHQHWNNSPFSLKAKDYTPEVIRLNALLSFVLLLEPVFDVVQYFKEKSVQEAEKSQSPLSKGNLYPIIYRVLFSIYNIFLFKQNVRLNKTLPTYYDTLERLSYVFSLLQQHTAVEDKGASLRFLNRTDNDSGFFEQDILDALQFRCTSLARTSLTLHIASGVLEALYCGSALSLPMVKFQKSSLNDVLKSNRWSVGLKLAVGVMMIAAGVFDFIYKETKNTEK